MAQKTRQDGDTCQIKYFTIQRRGIKKPKGMMTHGNPDVQWILTRGKHTPFGLCHMEFNIEWNYAI